MTIASLDNYLAAAKTRRVLHKTASRTSVAAMSFSVFDLAGNPAGGALAIGNTANGLVPDDTVAGYPEIPAASGTLYLSRVEFASNVTCRLTIYDRLFAAGAYAYNADVSLADQPSFAARVPGTDYRGLELWVETVTACTGNLAVQVDYESESGVGGATGAVGVGATPILGRCWQLPLGSGHKGVSKVTRVRGTVASAGTFNVNVLRRLWTGRVPVATFGDTHDLLKTGLPVLYGTSALYMLVTADSTATGIPEVTIEVADG